MSPLLMTALIREYWAACRNPNEPASKAFFRSQADNRYWERLADRCLARVSPTYSDVIAATSFSGDCA